MNHFGCDHQSESFRVPYILSQVIPAWTHLKSLRVGAINGATWVHLAQHRTLHRLEVRFPAVDVHLGSPSAPGGNAVFPALDKLTLRSLSWGLRGATGLLRSTGGRGSLIDLHVDSCIQPQPTELGDFTSAVADHCSAESLTNFYCSEKMFNDWGLEIADPYDAEFGITFNTLQPLMSFSRLESLMISGKRLVLIKDDELLELASAWPQLRVLGINAKAGWIVTSRVTFIGLAKLIEVCPLLMNLYISIDTSSPTDNIISNYRDNMDRASSTETQVPGAALRYLYFPRTRVDARDVKRIAAFFAVLLVNSPHATVYGTPENWLKVSSAIRRITNELRRTVLADNKQPEDTSGPVSRNRASELETDSDEGQIEEEHEEDSDSSSYESCASE
ncbi:hypothetical protein CONPUDRAFT_152522 [Coniophora puteana RWD-64-598 SS2]|uniref:F-box domain-containing protein n=1 Tax=Coniophora puteana (strain RWD-64-598) TaxID=741705 RepID=A0A5M3MWH2_CONPW|nr:uncharacterized protein CONPUDRAFT_152522 [Coniophora puteana RWD-64-598 SS2]EIW83503.1 hypothetical protein CONPUDRAFT_152522 [Coniophora puteana RWD-64-598 SS2]